MVASLTENVSNGPEDGAGGLTKLSELAVGDEQLTECSQALQSLVGLLLGTLLVNGNIGLLCGTTADLLGLPDEILKQVALVLCENENLGRLNDVLDVASNLLTLGRKFLRRGSEHLGFKRAV